MIDRDHQLPLTRQSQILELSRSSLYYQAVSISDRDLELMRVIDELHMKHPQEHSGSASGQRISGRPSTCKHPDEKDGHSGHIQEAQVIQTPS